MHQSTSVVLRSLLFCVLSTVRQQGPTVRGKLGGESRRAGPPVDDEIICIIYSDK